MLQKIARSFYGANPARARRSPRTRLRDASADRGAVVGTAACTRAEGFGEALKVALALAIAACLDGVFRTDHHHIVASGGASGEMMGLVATVREILKCSVEGKAIEGLQFFDRRETTPSDR